MKRKVIQIADSTQLVSLPRKWAILHNVKKGDEVDIEELGKKLILSVHNTPEVETAKLQYTTAEKFIKRPISMLYKLGYDEIQVEFEDPSVMELVQKEMQRLVGFEIVSQSRNNCIIKSVATASDSEFDPILRRIFLMLITMAKDSYAMILEKQFDQLKELTKLEETNNKLTLFCLRLLSKSGYSNYKKTSLVYNVVCHLEYLADEFRDICFYLMINKPKLCKKSLDCYKAACDQLEFFYKMFYKQDRAVGDLYEFKKRRLYIDKCAFELLGTNRHDTIIGHYVLKISDKLHHALESIH